MDRTAKLDRLIDDTIRDYPCIVIPAGIVLAGTVAFSAGNARAQHASAGRGAKRRARA